MINVFIDATQLKTAYSSVGAYQTALDSVIAGGAVMALFSSDKTLKGIELQIPDDADPVLAENTILAVEVKADESDAAKEQIRQEKYSEFYGDKVFDALADLRRRVETLERDGGAVVK